MYVMGDGLQVRQKQLDKVLRVQRVSVTRARRCLLRLGAIGMLVVVCSLLLLLCVVVPGFCAGRSGTETTAER